MENNTGHGVRALPCSLLASFWSWRTISAISVGLLCICRMKKLGKWSLKTYFHQLHAVTSSQATLSAFIYFAKVCFLHDEKDRQKKMGENPGTLQFWTERLTSSTWIFQDTFVKNNLENLLQDSTCCFLLSGIMKKIYFIDLTTYTFIDTYSLVGLPLENYMNWYQITSSPGYLGLGANLNKGIC